MIRVCVVDDQTLVRRGVAELLSHCDDIRVVAEAADGEEALRLIRETSADVVLLDVRMPEMGGIEVLHELTSKGCPARVVMLTTFDDDEALLSAMRAGASGFLLKDTSLEELAGAVRQVARGESIVRPGVTERVRRAIEDMRGKCKKPAPASSELTEREREILRLLAGGYSNREIGAALGVAEGTVKNHVSNLLAKMGVRDRTRAVLKGLDLGWI